MITFAVWRTEEDVNCVNFRNFFNFSNTTVPVLAAMQLHAVVAFYYFFSMCGVWQ
jgi:hypothetical protein